MFYKNIFEYLENQQSPDDVYYKYRKHRKKICLQFEAQTAGKNIYNEAADILEKEIQKVLDNQ